MKFTENMFREVIKWTSRVFYAIQLYSETYIAYYKIRLHAIKCENISFDIGRKNILGSLHT
jgi:hypothetical protein